MNPSQNVMILLVFMLFMTQSLVTYSISNRCHVHVINGFSNQTLVAHCKSKDDDLGVRHIPIHDEFQWTFRTDFWSRTRFSCHMWWKGGEKYLDVFWMDNKFIENECGLTDCRWRSQDDGIYLFSYQHKQYRLKQKWDPWHKSPRS
ncbi:hypothetical protein DITRI_Ditri13aG0112300 [Diplodiscus trichospermus]